MDILLHKLDGNYVCLTCVNGIVHVWWRFNEDFKPCWNTVFGNIVKIMSEYAGEEMYGLEYRPKVSIAL